VTCRACAVHAAWPLRRVAKAATRTLTGLSPYATKARKRREKAAAWVEKKRLGGLGEETVWERPEGDDGSLQNRAAGSSDDRKAAATRDGGAAAGGARRPAGGANAGDGRGETAGNAGNERRAVKPNVGFAVFSGCFQKM